MLRRLEETGRIRRAYFVAGLGAAQFAQPGAVDLLRDARDARDEVPTTVTLSATDPANPFGVLVPWPVWPASALRGATRMAGARVVLVDGRLVCWIARDDHQWFVSFTENEPDRSCAGRAMARQLVRLALARDRRSARMAD